MADEQLLTAVAVALTTDAAKALTQASRDAFAGLISLLRRRFAGHPSSEQALELAQQDPTSAVRVEALVNALMQAQATNPDFEAELRHAWLELRAHLNADQDAVVNSVSGTIGGNVVQARDVTGGISFGDTGRHLA
jgi:hypothetical protein